MQDIVQNILSQMAYDPKQPLIFSSGMFLVMWVLFTGVYYMLHGKNTARIAFVTLFSYYFYYKSSGFYFFLLAIVTVSDFAIAKRMLTRPAHKKTLLLLSLLIDLGLLAYFKYTNFFGATLAGIIGANFQPWDIFLPVGISFFTFQSLSYTIDVYRGQLRPLDSLLDYAFYVSFFPQLVAGPIVRARDFVPQIRRPVTITREMMAMGVYLVLIGLFKKAVISDYISVNFVDRIFDNPLRYTGVENLLGSLGYTLQLYCDFSGYSDMAIGLALLLGFHFPKNFNAPYKAVSVRDFWRRWHISLSTWIRDYVYISMGGNRKGKARTYVHLLATMLLAGLWHGAAWNFIAWGGLHGLALACHKFYRQYIVRHDKGYRSQGLKRVGGMIVTFAFVSFAWLIFRNRDMGNAGIMLQQMLTNFHGELIGQVLLGYKWVMLLMAFGLVSHYVPEKWENAAVKALSKCNVMIYAILLAALIYLICQIKTSDIQPFIYFQF